MRTEVVEVFYGKHAAFRVIRRTTLLGTEYQVRTEADKYLGTFRRLDEAVAWARERARKG